MNHKFITSLLLFSVSVFSSGTLFAGRALAHPANSPLTLCATPDDSVLAPVVAEDTQAAKSTAKPDTGAIEMHPFPVTDGSARFKGEKKP